jgi:AcrR family transcriptional regulator
MPTNTSDRRTARERLLAAADELFYEEGVHVVGIDRVIERAGVAKATLYSTFGSKDGLIRAYLVQRHQARQNRLTGKLAGYDTPRERLLAVFDALGDVFQESGFRGCAFINASAEAHAGSVVEEQSDEIRAWIRGLFTGLAREAAAAAPERLAGQLVLLYDGATVGAQMDRDPTVAANARLAAEALIDAAVSATAVPTPVAG